MYPRMPRTIVFGHRSHRMDPVAVTATELTALLAVAISGYTDLRSQRIPNWTTYPAAAIGLVLNAAASLQNPFADPTDPSPQRYLAEAGFQDSILGFLACFLLMFAIYCVARGGAGDVKLAAALGALLGLRLGITVILYTYILAGIGTLCLVILKRGVLFPFRVLWASLQRLLWLGGGQVGTEDEELLQSAVPLGAWFAVATVLVIFGPPLLAP